MEFLINILIRNIERVKKSMCNIRVEDLEKSVQDLSNFIKADKIMMVAHDTLFWVKDLDLKHLKINQAACDLLYPGATPKDLVGLTDWEYSQKIGCSGDMVKRIKEGCSVSDHYLLNSDEISCKFYEKVKTTEDEEIWLLITKEKVPPTQDKSSILGIYGTAIKFPYAEFFIENNYMGNIEKLTNTVYLVRE